MHPPAVLQPGRITAELAVELPRPRDRRDPRFDALVETVYDILTGREDQARAAATGRARPAPAPKPADLPLFAAAAAARAPLIGAIVKALSATKDGSLRKGFFLDLLRRGFSAEDARRQLDTAVDWGRYAELFEYDAEHGELVLESAAASHAV